MFLRIVHIALALLVFVSSTGAPLFRHYCMNRVKEVSLFAKAKSCQAQEKVCSIPLQKPDGIQRKACCQDRVDYLKISSDLTDHFTSFHVTLDVVAVLPTLPAYAGLATAAEWTPWQHYRPPPPPDRAIHIWVQSFLC